MAEDTKRTDAGWYTDPRDSTMERWFDGEEWSQAVRRRVEA